MKIKTINSVYQVSKEGEEYIVKKIAPQPGKEFRGNTVELKDCLWLYKIEDGKKESILWTSKIISIE